MLRFAAFLTAIAVLVGCDRISTVLDSGPESTLSAYLDAVTQGELERAYGLISARDRAARSLTDYQGASDEGLARAFAGMVTHEIVEVTEQGDTATAQVDVTAPDFSQVMGEMMGPALAAAFGGELDPEKLAQDLASKYKSGDLPKVTRREEFKLVRDSDGWHMFMDWEREERVDALIAEANQLREAEQLAAAATKYGQALELDGELVEARIGLEDVRKDLEKREADAVILREKQDYIGSLQLKDFRVANGERFGRSVKSIFGTIVNQGDRTLDEVEVTVYFLDQKGNIVGEEDYHPVLVSKYSVRDNKPLKPNYVKDFGYSVADTAPSAWAGRAQAKITDIAFAE